MKPLEELERSGVVFAIAVCFLLTGCGENPAAIQKAREAAFNDAYWAAHREAYDPAFRDAYKSARSDAYAETRDSLVASGQYSFNRPVLLVVVIVALVCGFVLQYAALLRLRRSELLQGDLDRMLLSREVASVDFRRLRQLEQGATSAQKWRTR